MQPEAMRVHAKATDRPDFAQILAHVRSLRPQIASRALAAEKAKRVPAETMDALRDTAVFRLMQPARFGGYEYGPAELAEIGFELAPGGAEHWPFASVG
jgi:3-hydroxy-9,10-secoandrosta-1,3,5(10)-triene-9,17-dione monooxygenase